MYAKPRLPDPVRTAAVRAVIVVALTLVQLMVALLCSLAEVWLAFPMVLGTVAGTVLATWCVLDVWVTRQVWVQRHGVVSEPSSVARPRPGRGRADEPAAGSAGDGTGEPDTSFGSGGWDISVGSGGSGSGGSGGSGEGSGAAASPGRATAAGAASGGRPVKGRAARGRTGGGRTGGSPLRGSAPHGPATADVTGSRGRSAPRGGGTSASR